METTDKIKKIPVEKLKAGMVLAENVYDENKNLVFPQNVPIASSLQINKLKNLKIEYVLVDVGKSNFNEVVNSIDDNNESNFYINEFLDCLNQINDLIHHLPRASEEKLRYLAGQFVEYIARYGESIIAITKRVKTYEDYFFSHSINVATIMTYISLNVLSCTKEHAVEVFIIGFLHDVGKLIVDENIIKKNKKLSDGEWENIKKHPQYGVRLVEAYYRFAPRVSKIILQHHERFDGSGYPSGLRRAEIDNEAYLLGMVDVYDAMTTDRAYKNRAAAKIAISEIYSWKDRLFPAPLVNKMLIGLGMYGIGSLVALTSGEIGVVTEVRGHKLNAPQVMIVFDKNRVLQKPGKIVELSDSHSEIRNEINNHEFEDLNILEYFREKFI